MARTHDFDKQTMANSVITLVLFPHQPKRKNSLAERVAHTPHKRKEKRLADSLLHWTIIEVDTRDYKSLCTKRFSLQPNHTLCSPLTNRQQHAYEKISLVFAVAPTKPSQTIQIIGYTSNYNLFSSPACCLFSVPKFSQRSPFECRVYAVCICGHDACIRLMQQQWQQLSVTLSSNV